MTKKVCSRKEKSTMLLQTARIFLRELTDEDFVTFHYIYFALPANFVEKWRNPASW